ncbi:MAG: phosphoribosylglycinamide formyltransferase [Alphaproteobacteria bacterium]
MAVLNVGILISGRGSNMQALAADLARPGAPARVALVVSNRPDAAGLQAAAALGLATETVDHAAFADREAFEAAVTAALEAAGCRLVCLAGFMRVLGPAFVRHWAGRLVNIHPSLLPAYKGLHSHARALADGAAEAGCSVHWVTDELDGGPVIAQRRVPVFADDTAETLADRVLEQEHRLYPEVVRAIAHGTVRARA